MQRRKNQFASPLAAARAIFTDTCQEKYGTNFDELHMAPAREVGFGHVTTNAAFGIGRQVGLPARQVGEQISKELRKHPLINDARSAGPGFINIRFEFDCVAHWLAALLNKEFGCENEFESHPPINVTCFVCEQSERFSSLRTEWIAHAMTNILNAQGANVQFKRGGNGLVWRLFEDIHAHASPESNITFCEQAIDIPSESKDYLGEKHCLKIVQNERADFELSSKENRDPNWASIKFAALLRPHTKPVGNRTDVSKEIEFLFDLRPQILRILNVSSVRSLTDAETDFIEGADLSSMGEAELAVLSKAFAFSHVLRVSVWKYDVSHLVRYLVELARLTHRMLQGWRRLNFINMQKEDNLATNPAKQAILSAVFVVISEGFGILDVDPVPKNKKAGH